METMDLGSAWGGLSQAVVPHGIPFTRLSLPAPSYCVSAPSPSSLELTAPADWSCSNWEGAQAPLPASAPFTDAPLI